MTFIIRWASLSVMCYLGVTLILWSIAAAGSFILLNLEPMEYFFREWFNGLSVRSFIVASLFVGFLLATSDV